MTTSKRSARKGSQMSRLDRAMTALAEAQARTAAGRAKLNDAMDALADAQAETEAQFAKTDAELSNLSPETRALGRQLQAYLNKLPKN